MNGWKAAAGPRVTRHSPTVTRMTRGIGPEVIMVSLVMVTGHHSQENKQEPRERAVSKQPPQLTPGSEAAVDENRGQFPRSASLSWPDPWQSEDTMKRSHNNIIITVSRSFKRYIQILCPFK